MTPCRYYLCMLAPCRLPWCAPLCRDNHTAVLICNGLRRGKFRGISGEYFLFLASRRTRRRRQTTAIGQT
ncbi:hypothetical protein BN2497_4735 [Janthinobacterium sp. CG23_2]|nr:hypothetical protein BN2497_4735 [Janthinobacterium sp. CG23_2]CUU28765.1 hypothetical protein BN3177_4735 [Janthinobacterium sp. CG23_2]